MKIKCHLLLLSLSALLIHFNGYAQKGYIDKVNQYNSAGKKEGYWIEKDKAGCKTELYYKNGIKNGFCKVYFLPGDGLGLFAEYKNGVLTGTYYLFGDKGHIIMTLSDFKPNDIMLIDDSGKKYRHDYQCYSRSFHPNGVLKNEGLLLWSEDPVTGEFNEYGHWKYYDETGKLTKSKVFK